MCRRVLGSLLLAAVLALALYANHTSAPPTAEATLPPGCPAAAGVGTTDYVVTAVLPVGAPANANGVCITLTGTGGTNNSGVVVINPAGCPAPTAGAGTSNVWADWGANNCVAPGQSVRIAFKNGGTLPLDPQCCAAVWSLQGGGTFTSGVVIKKGGSVGGVAGEPDLNQLAAVGSKSGDSSVTPYAAGGGAAAFVVLASVLTGAWYVRRRRRAQ